MEFFKVLKRGAERRKRDFTRVRDKFSMKKVPTALFFPHTQAVPQACSQRSSML